jgi:hypothetical protein
VGARSVSVTLHPPDGSQETRLHPNPVRRNRLATSAWTAKANKRVQFGYGLNYLIDTAIGLPSRHQPERKAATQRLFQQYRS